MTQQLTRMRARRRGERGFTLIELLVVIVILGVLAAVVVFAVQGAGDKGDLAARQTDTKTLRTAQEAYCAQNGTYAADDAALVNSGFLAEGGTLHHTKMTTPGPCGGTGFVVTCDPNQATCGPDGSTPDGNFPGAAGATSTGMWSRTGDLPEGASTATRLITMPNGKVLSWGRKNGSPPSTPAGGDWTPGPLAVFDPGSASWVGVPSVPGPAWNPLLGARMIVITGSAAECGVNCGKVLVQADVGRTVSPDNLNNNYFLFDPVAFDAGDPPWQRVADPTATSFVTGVGSRMAQIRCTRVDPLSDCGKVMVTAGFDSNAGSLVRPDPELQVALWDPAGPSTPAAWALTVQAARRVGDATVTNLSTTMTSPTAAFTSADIGHTVFVTSSSGTGGGVPGSPGTVISSVVSSTQVVLSRPATFTRTGNGRLTIGTAYAGGDLVTLRDGRILAASKGSSTYDPSTHLWSKTANNMADPAFYYGCPTVPSPPNAPQVESFGPSLLPDGRVLVLGAAKACSSPSLISPAGNTLVFDPTVGANGTWSLGALCSCLSPPSSVVLAPQHGSRVLMVNAADQSSVGLYAASAILNGASWTTITSTFTRRALTAAGAPKTGAAVTGIALLPSGQVLLAGGSKDPSLLQVDTWLYTPPVP